MKVTDCRIHLPATVNVYFKFNGNHSVQSGQSGKLTNMALTINRVAKLLCLHFACVSQLTCLIIFMSLKVQLTNLLSMTENV